MLCCSIWELVPFSVLTRETCVVLVLVLVLRPVVLVLVLVLRPVVLVLVLVLRTLVLVLVLVLQKWSCLHHCLWRKYKVTMLLHNELNKGCWPTAVRCNKGYLTNEEKSELIYHNPSPLQYDLHMTTELREGQILRRECTAETSSNTQCTNWFGNRKLCKIE